MKYDVIDFSNKKTGTIELSDDIFNREVRSDILARVIEWQLAKRRAGTHAVKNFSEVSGTGKKPFRQKGGGRARQGTLRGSQFRHGAVAFGPVVRSHAYDLNKKIRKLGLKCALSLKAQNGNLFIVDNLGVKSAKTKDLQASFKKCGWTSALVIGGAVVDKQFALAARNLVNVDVLPQAGANVYDVVRRQQLVLTKEAVAYLEALLK